MCSNDRCMYGSELLSYEQQHTNSTNTSAYKPATLAELYAGKNYTPLVLSVAVFLSMCIAGCFALAYLLFECIFKNVVLEILHTFRLPTEHATTSIGIVEEFDDLRDDDDDPDASSADPSMEKNKGRKTTTFVAPAWQ